MNIHEIIVEHGRVVKGVNTTADVGTDEIKTQAAKFGFNVDKDGRPPQLAKKTKGANSNVAFNLGLTEGYQLKLERDENIDVLHIMDTKTKKRIEVRGKKGYETDGYDPQDKLHQVLDKVGRSANISELMNGNVVGINPNHPQGADAEKTADDVLTTEKQRLDPKCWKGYRKDGTQMKNGVRVNKCVKVKEDEYTWEGDLEMLYDNEEMLDEAEYQGRKVKLGKPMQGDVKKFKVYVKNPKGNVVKVNFGSKEHRIKKSNPARRKSFRARHNCDSPGPRHKARYWSCRKW
jgi:hypothetical protein